MRRAVQVFSSQESDIVFSSMFGAFGFILATKKLACWGGSWRSDRGMFYFVSLSSPLRLVCRFIFKAAIDPTLLSDVKPLTRSVGLIHWSTLLEHMFVPYSCESMCGHWHSSTIGISLPVSSSFVDAWLSIWMLILSFSQLLPLHLEMFHIDDLLAFQNASVAFKLNCLRILEHVHLFLFTKEHFTHFLNVFFKFLGCCQ